MNIVFIGPGKDPERFGTYFCNKAEEDGHNVYKFSYRVVPELSTPADVEKDFVEFLSKIDKVDLMVYNCIGGMYPGHKLHYQQGHQMEWVKWYEGVTVNAAMPHMFSIRIQEKMDSNSAIAMMTSSASYLINRDNYVELAGYFGSKGMMNQLAKALAKYNSHGLTVTTLAPHIPYDEPDMARKIMDTLYGKITNLTKYDSGKIIECYPPEANLNYWKFDGRYNIEDQ